jgi:Ulp1 family protease
MGENRKYIMVIHYSFHWSVVVIDNINKKINTYDSGVTISKYSHKEPHIALKKSIEDITGKQWNMEQIPVPQQDEGESCGYRMLSNLKKIVKGQEIRSEKDKECNRLYYYLEIAQTLKDNQPDKKKPKQKKEKRGRGKRRR